MAVQLHQRRCPRQHDESLDVALRQLSLTEEQVRGFLSLGKPEQQPPVAQPLSRIVAEVDRLVAPAARHGHVAWECEPPAADDDPTVANAHSVRAGLLNLVLNGVQAAGSGGSTQPTGSGGRVRLSTERIGRHVQIHVADSGSGPPESLRSSMFEPFITSKPEGIGLGLALAKAAAEEHGGSLTFAARRRTNAIHDVLGGRTSAGNCPARARNESLHNGRRRFASREPGRGRELRARLT